MSPKARPKKAGSKKAGSWDDVSWIKIGTRVRYLGSEVGSWTKPDKSDLRTLKPGMTGLVVGFTAGYPPHPCPDHDGGDTCTCGSSSGIVSAEERMGIVAWDAKGGEYQRLISRDGEGDRYERIS